MNIWKNEHHILIEDFEYIASDSTIPWKDFSGKTILITGASGLIGSLLVKFLLYYSDLYNIDMRIIAFVRNKDSIDINFKNQHSLFDKKLYFYIDDIRNSLKISYDIDYIIHAASNTSSLDFINKPVDVITTTIDGTKNILECAINKKITSCVYISSMEVYGKIDHEYVDESDLGYIDILSPRSSYPQSKRMAETLCFSYVSQYGAPIKILRPTLIFGAGVKKSDKRVFMQFAKSVLNHEDIILNTLGNTKRDYIYTADAIRGILSVLLLGKNGEAYNLSNPETYCTIRELAELIATFGKDSKVTFDCDIQKQKQYAPEVRICLTSNKIDNINKFEKIPLRTIIERMILYIKSNTC